ncbi:MAG: TIGR00730 family Rossman fold protein [Bacteroidia bacterium]
MQTQMDQICVFCGSNAGNNPVYISVARELGHLFASRGIGLVYGGGNVGLMGIIADAVLEAGGKVTGVIPEFLLAKEVGHTSLTEMIVVKTMHERKQRMADLSQGFIAMPGGFGTLDELCEILTWGQLGLHGFPIGLLNVNNYFQPLVQMFDHMVGEKFLHPQNRSMVLAHDQPQGLLTLMESWQPPNVEKWMDRAKV